MVLSILPSRCLVRSVVAAGTHAARVGELRRQFAVEPRRAPRRRWPRRPAGSRTRRWHSYLAELHDQGRARRPRRRVAAALLPGLSPANRARSGKGRAQSWPAPGGPPTIGGRSGRLTWPPSSHLPTAAASRPWRRVRGNVALKRDRLAARRSTLRRVLERAAPGARPGPQGERRRCELLGVRGAASGRSTTWKGDGRGGGRPPTPVDELRRAEVAVGRRIAASSAHTSPGSTRFSPGCWKWTLNPRSFSTSMSRSASRIVRLRASSGGARRGCPIAPGRAARPRPSSAATRRRRTRPAGCQRHLPGTGRTHPTDAPSVARPPQRDRRGTRFAPRTLRGPAPTARRAGRTPRTGRSSSRRRWRGCRSGSRHAP